MAMLARSRQLLRIHLTNLSPSCQTKPRGALHESAHPCMYQSVVAFGCGVVNALACALSSHLSRIAKDTFREATALNRRQERGGL